MTDRQLYAIQAIAEKQWDDEANNGLEDTVGFEFEGQWISNPWIDPSGRFPLTSEMTAALYGKGTFQKFCKDIVEQYGLNEFFRPSVTDADPLDGAVIGTITAWGPDDFSVEWLELPDRVQEDLFDLVEPHCTSSVRGSLKALIKDIRTALAPSLPLCERKEIK